MVVTVAAAAAAGGVFSKEDLQEAPTAPRPYLLETSGSSAHSFDDLCQRRPRSLPGLASATVKIPWEMFGRGRDGEVTIVRSHLTGNVASNDGGGIFNADTVNLTKTKFKNNDPNDCTGCPWPTLVKEEAEPPEVGTVWCRIEEYSRACWCGGIVEKWELQAGGQRIGSVTFCPQCAPKAASMVNRPSPIAPQREEGDSTGEMFR